MHLAIANKRYSSWSLRPWLVLKVFDIPFEETVIPLRRDDTGTRIAEFSPSGRLPALTDGEVKVWESLAIIEYLAETFPDKAIWPRNRVARAHARAISNEMHGGFQALRQACPMNLGKRFVAPHMTHDLKTNVVRIEDIWREAHNRFGGGGPFLFGEFSAADAMYAPVVTRLDTYGITVGIESRVYMQAILEHPAYQEWRSSALAESWDIAEYEAGHVVLESYLPVRP